MNNPFIFITFFFITFFFITFFLIKNLCTEKPNKVDQHNYDLGMNKIRFANISDIIELWHNYSIGWTISLEVIGFPDSRDCNFRLRLSHPLILMKCTITKYPDGTLTVDGVIDDMRFDKHQYNDLVSLIEDMIGIPIGELTDGIFDYIN
jgi:hypothetical protein